METTQVTSFAHALGFADYAVVAVGFIVLFLITYFKGREQTDTNDFFLGRRKIPGWAACLSFIATEVSALTIVGVPATGFRENWQYLQFFIGSAAARIFIAYIFIPSFYHYKCVTIYEFLGHRFGKATQYANSVFFFITRLIASGVRLYAASLAVGIIMGWDLKLTLLLFTCISILFIGFGGIKAIVWTGAFEASTFYLAGLALIFYLGFQIQGGLSEAWHVAENAGRLSLFNLGWNPADPNVLWLAILNGLFVSMAAFGTDQELMQRLLTVETRESSQKTLLWTIAASLPVTAIYMAVGPLLFVFYQQNPALPLPDNTDKILSHFVVNVLPVGLKGLILLAVIMASIDSPLGSLSSSFVTDIYRTTLNPGKTEKHYLTVSRLSVLVFGIILAVIAYSCRSLEGILWFAFKIIGVTAGSMLGIFLLGFFTKTKVNRMNVISMTVNSLAMAALLILSEKKYINLGWSILIIIGTVGTFALSLVLAKYFPEKDTPQEVKQH